MPPKIIGEKRVGHVLSCTRCGRTTPTLMLNSTEERPKHRCLDAIAEFDLDVLLVEPVSPKVPA